MTDYIQKVDADEWPRERIELLKRTICKDSTDQELELFIGVCKRTRLDPFTRQIYCVARYNSVKDDYGNWRKEKSMTIQVSIDGLRLIAERTGEYEGQTKPEWCGDDGKWLDSWIKDAPPVAARVGIWRKGFREPLYRQARWKAFAQRKKDGTPNAMWASMPEIMLLKCAESQALRASFPQETSGLYTQEEMSQSESPTEEPQKPRKKHEPIPNALPVDSTNDFPDSYYVKSEEALPANGEPTPSWDENGEVIDTQAEARDERTKEATARLLLIDSEEAVKSWCFDFGAYYMGINNNDPFKKSWRSALDSCRKKYGIAGTQIQEWLEASSP